MKKIIKSVIRILVKILYIFPVNQNKIYMTCFDGGKFGFDQKAILEYIDDKESNKYVFIWGANKKLVTRNIQIKNVIFCKINSLRWLYHVMTSRVCIYNINPPSYIPFRKNQLLINTWHGFGIKVTGKYAPHFDKRQFNKSTCFLSQSEFYTDRVLRESFEYSGEIINTGAPRNDVLFSKKSKDIANQVKEKYNVKDKKIILYAPTFRNDFNLYMPSIDFTKVLNNIQNKFGGEWVIFLRLHPMLTERVDLNRKYIVDVSGYDDMQELLCASDILISDYSSTIWDFALQKRPVFIYADDLEKYKKSRGFYYNIEDAPYLVAQNNEELCNNIQKFNNKDYLNKLEKFSAKVNSYENGQACKKVYEYISQKINRN